ncbi:ParA family protein [Ensifer aridi]|uniref:ParA family protein n=1 Tax=Ensifer aridi TaxID=1708715 RepID=UPI000A10BCD8|nr:ParA family protein [Ensifer aridi]
MRPLSLAISTFKGGAGKTTLCINLAAEFAEQGLRAQLIDCDDQQTATRWYETSKKRGVLRGDKLSQIWISPEEDFEAKLETAPPADVRIYDVGGYAHSRAVDVYEQCDAVLIPVILEPTSATRAINVARILDEISTKRGGRAIPYAAIWNNLDMIALKSNRSLPEVVKILTFGKIPIADSIIKKSNHFSDVMAGYGSLYSKLEAIDSNPKLVPSARLRARESVLDAIDSIKMVNNEFITLLSDHGTRVKEARLG